MPTTITKTVFTFDELSDSAKETARQWFREATADDNFYAESVIEDAASVAALLGIDFDMSRGSRTQRAVYWSGFSSQGDGASFEGSYRYAKGSVKAVAAYAPEDKELQRIACELYRIQRINFYALRASCKHRGHYMHSGCMSVSVGTMRDSMADSSEEDVTQALRDFADWIYRQLESAYEWDNADEQVDANICANEYTFDENGNREG